MYKSDLWQVVLEDPGTGEHSIINRNVHKEAAIRIAEKLQSAADRKHCSTEKTEARTEK
jgi:hypothetical protein